ncbi:hypothetical protein GCM10010910_09690 [Microbacterium nanhaiense]|uniref:EcsC protein family protein n=1 Tax=Microbacterium nanhaiense TaxID=1301026 RepID=A0ABQ2N3D9_9MICO|nr:hypothetical protein [Microbacterium nanhaiense]GGO61569.1 hypothetical protein GCM10010910_09690 [Microbacterium nanhaiense]
MDTPNEIQSAGTKFTQVLDAAAKLPGVRINRAQYLRTALKRHCAQDQIEEAIRTSPAAAGIPMRVITEVANTSITYETTKVSGISAVAGLPGGLAMIGTVPADLAQYMGHMLRIAQKLAYIYSWPDLFAEGDELDEATESVLTLFVGVMFGVQIAQGGVTKLAAMIAANVAKKLPQKALTKGLIYPVVKKVAGYIGVSMTKKMFASGVAKAIPVVGAVLSGGLTLGTFLPMSKRLQKHLASLELTHPSRRHASTAEADDVIVLAEIQDEDGEARREEAAQQLDGGPSNDVESEANDG